MSDHEEKLTAEAKAYIDKMKASLRELGVNLANGVDIQEQARVISNRIAANEAAAQHDLDCAARERDTAQARVKELEGKLEALKRERHDETLRSGERIQDLTRRCADLEANHATEIKASSTVNTSLMRQISKAHEALDAAGIPRSAEEDGEPGSPWTLGQRIAVLLIPGDDESPAEWAINEIDKIVHGEPRPFACDLDKLIAEVKVMKANIATEKADPTRDYNAEIVAARIDALKTLGVNPYDPPVCVVGAAKKRAKTLEHAEKLEADVAAVWELWGAGREREPGKLHELCQEQERLSSALESKLRVVTEKLDAAKVPTHYGREQKGGPIALPERMDLLVASHDCARTLADAWETSSMREAEERVDAAAVLDELGAPDHAGSIHLSIAARIRALPGLLRP